MRSSTGPRPRARAHRIALAAVLALGWLLAAPGAASAAPKLEPTIDCALRGADGSVTFVLGHENTLGYEVTSPVGARNSLSPARLQGTQPTVFAPGETRGAFTVRVTEAELRAGARWVLEDETKDFAKALATARACPSSTELPDEGNGTGPAIALAVAGVVGGVVVHRANRRATTGGGSTDA